MPGVLLTLALAAALSGCGHNDVLVFGTDTKLALDVTTGVSEGASPSITVGYKRKEAIWMPLLVNGRDSRVVPCVKKPQTEVCENGTTSPWPADGAKYETVRETTKAGVTTTERTLPSLLASIGASFGGSAAKGAEARGGLTQWIATGRAADLLAENKALVTAFKVESAEGAQSQAQAIESATMSDHATWYAAEDDIRRNLVESCNLPDFKWRPR